VKENIRLVLERSSICTKGCSLRSIYIFVILIGATSSRPGHPRFWRFRSKHFFRQNKSVYTHHGQVEAPANFNIHYLTALLYQRVWMHLQFLYVKSMNSVSTKVFAFKNFISCLIGWFSCIRNNNALRIRMRTKGSMRHPITFTQSCLIKIFRNSFLLLPNRKLYKTVNKALRLISLKEWKEPMQWTISRYGALNRLIK